MPSGRTSVAPAGVIPYAFGKPGAPTDCVVDAGHGELPGLRSGQEHEPAAEQVEGGASVAQGHVRRARARAPVRRRRVLAHRAVLAGLLEHGRGVHERADLDGEVVDRRLDVVGAALRDDPRRVARVGLLDRHPAQGAALGVVGVQERGPGLALHDRRELPREVVGVLDPGVAAEAAVGGHDVRGVARQEHAAVGEARRHVGLRLPVGDVEDLHGQVGRADRGDEQLPRALLGQPVADVHRLLRRDVRADGVDDEEALAARPVEPEEPAQRRVVDVDDALVAVLSSGAQSARK